MNTTNRLSHLLALGYLAVLLGWIAATAIERRAMEGVVLPPATVPCMHQPQCPIIGKGL